MIKQYPNLLIGKVFFPTGHTNQFTNCSKNASWFFLLIISATVYFKLFASVMSLYLIKVCFITEFL